MIIPYEVFEENKRFKESIENSEDEIDRMLYKAARAYSNSIMVRAKEVTDVIMECVKKEIKTIGRE